MYNIDDIVHHTGIPSNKVMEICNLLSMEGYLIYNKETGKYRLTKDRDLLSNVKKLWNQYKDEHTFEQMSGKIEDIIEFGKPLALSEKGPGKSVQDIGVPGLNIIFGSMESKREETTKRDEVDIKKVPGLPRGHCLLIRGAPGTGKTTLGIQIALYLKKYRARFLTFEEDANQLINDLHGYIQKDDNNDHAVGWKKSDIKEVTRSLIKIRTPNAWEDPDIVMDELISIFDRELPHLIVIDCISRFRDLGGDTKARQILRRLIRNLKCRRITSIFMAEDRGEENTFEEFEVDGVINLQWAGELLSLNVTKLRGMKAYKGPHSAALMTVEDLEQPQHLLISEKRVKKERKKIDDYEKIGPYLTAGFNVFPDISVFKDIPGNITSDKKENEDKPISTGTSGLDDLLPLPNEEKGFKRGETILLVGSSGAGKTLLALNFMLNGFGRKNQPNNEHTLWINLEGDIGTLEFAVKGFEGEYKEDIEKMLNFAKKKDLEHTTEEKEPRFDFIDFPPINLDLNKIIYTLEAIHQEYKIDRLVIDSITELERAKGGGQPAVKVFLAGLIQFLRDRKITTVFVCRSDAFFRSIDKIEEQVSSLVDLIICIRNFDIHNQIHKGIYIQKARGRQHNSKIIRMIIDSKREIEIEDSGWDLENLLAGDTSNIESPRIFFKLFYENPAEEFINKKIIEDFDEHRYPGDDPKFTLVKKPSIYTEFWSFKGQFSAGHANTRVLSLADPVISAFRDNDRLAELDKYVKSELLQNITSEEHLKKLYRLRDRSRNQDKNDKKSEINDKYTQNNDEDEQYVRLRDLSIDSIPCYRDYGVIVSKHLSEGNSNLIKLIKGLNNNKESSIKKEEFYPDNEWVNKEYTWEKLLEFIKEYNEQKGKGKNKTIPFAFPPLDNRSEFVAFFMELLWSYGGDIYEIDIGEKYLKIGYGRKFKKYLRCSVFADFIGENQKYFGVKEEEIISILLNNHEPKKKSKIIKKFEKDIDKRFDIYGMDLKDIDIKKFKKWIADCLENLDKNCPERKSVLKLNDKPFEETIKLMMRLVHRADVINPIEGDFRDLAILSRNWYSRVYFTHKEKRDKKGRIVKREIKYNLLPLPLAKIRLPSGCSYYRSVTCLTYWSLVMLGNALSPEIGGNFIESINAPDYYEERLKNKSGMPVMNWEISKKKFLEFDPQSYSILRRIMDNGHENENTLNRIGNYFRARKDKKPPQDPNKKKKEFEIKKGIFKSENAFVRREFIEFFDSDEQKKYYDEHKIEINNRVFYPKVRHTRIAFYQLEQALYYQLRQLFIEGPGFRDKRLYNGENIVEEIKNLCKEERKSQKPEKPIVENEWDDCLGKISREFRMHVIFELLTYFYHEYIRGAEETGEEEK